MILIVVVIKNNLRDIFSAFNHGAACRSLFLTRKENIERASLVLVNLYVVNVDCRCCVYQSHRTVAFGSVCVAARYNRLFVLFNLNRLTSSRRF